MKKNTEMPKIKVILVMALTADGFTARSSSEYTDWTSAADKKLFSICLEKRVLLLWEIILLKP